MWVEVMDCLVDDGRQTDAAVTRCSERNQIRLACQFSLGDVMIDHFTRQKRALHTTALKDDQLFLGVQISLGKR